MTGKKYINAAKTFDRDAQFTPTEAIGIVKKSASATFDETIDLAIRLGRADPARARLEGVGTRSR